MVSAPASTATRPVKRGPLGRITAPSGSSSQRVILAGFRCDGVDFVESELEPIGFARRHEFLLDGLVVELEQTPCVAQVLGDPAAGPFFYAEPDHQQAQSDQVRADHQRTVRRRRVVAADPVHRQVVVLVGDR